MQDQDFMAGYRSEHTRSPGSLADTEDLPGAWAASNQISARSHFYGVIITTADIEFVSKNATGMSLSSRFEIWACAPFIPIYPVDWHPASNTIRSLSSCEE